MFVGRQQELKKLNMMYERSQFEFAVIYGRWWGSNPDKKRKEEIDILAVDDENAIFGECKWKNEPTGIGVLNELVEKSGLFNQYKSKYYMLFSKSGSPGN